jgi:hypothetical protein
MIWYLLFMGLLALATAIWLIDVFSEAVPDISPDDF